MGVITETKRKKNEIREIWKKRKRKLRNVEQIKMKRERKEMAENK